MSSAPSENVTSPPKELIRSWTRAIWFGIIEVALFCTIPNIICPPQGYPAGTEFVGWAIFGLFYQSFERAPGLGSVSGQDMPIYLSVVTIIFFILNIATYFSVITKKNRGHSSPQGIRRRLKIALYGPVVWWLVVAGIQAIIGFAFCGTGCNEPGNEGTTIDIPVYLVALLPWILRFRYTKQAIKELVEEPIDETWAAPVRKAILELGTKYTRLQVNEIAEKVNVKNEKQIVAVVQDMIKREQIAAEYFKSSRTVAFDQQANTQALAKFITDLDGQFTAWGKDGKKA
jgi:hypothetical protein